MRYLGANALLRIGFSLGMGMPASAAIPLPDFGTCTPGGQTLGSVATGRALGKGSDRSLWPESKGPCVLLLSETRPQEDG